MRFLAPLLGLTLSASLVCGAVVRMPIRRRESLRQKLQREGKNVFFLARTAWSVTGFVISINRLIVVTYRGIFQASGTPTSKSETSDAAVVCPPKSVTTRTACTTRRSTLVRHLPYDLAYLGCGDPQGDVHGPLHLQVHHHSPSK